MRTITINDFINLITASAKNNKTLEYKLCDEQAKNSFLIVPSDGTEKFLLQVPEKSKYDFVYSQLKQAFAEDFEIMNSHDSTGHYAKYLFIKLIIIIEMDFDSENGQDWLYTNQQ